jgi:hypothetical protein
MHVKRSKRGRPPVSTNPVRVTVILDAEVVERADELAANMLGAAGVRVLRGDIIRGAIVRGLDAMTQEHATRVAP